MRQGYLALSQQVTMLGQSIGLETLLCTAIMIWLTTNSTSTRRQGAAAFVPPTTNVSAKEKESG